MTGALGGAEADSQMSGEEKQGASSRQTKSLMTDVDDGGSDNSPIHLREWKVKLWATAGFQRRWRAEVWASVRASEDSTFWRAIAGGEGSWTTPGAPGFYVFSPSSGRKLEIQSVRLR